MKDEALHEQMQRARNLVCFIEFPDGEIPSSRVFDTDTTLFSDAYGAVTISDVDTIEALPDILYDEFDRRVNVIALGTEEVVDLSPDDDHTAVRKAVRNFITGGESELSNEDSGIKRGKKVLNFDLLIQDTSRIEDLIFRELGRYGEALEPFQFIDSYDELFEAIEGRVVELPEAKRYPGLPAMQYRLVCSISIPKADKMSSQPTSPSEKFKNSVVNSRAVSFALDYKEGVLVALIAEAIIRTVEHVLADDDQIVRIGPAPRRQYQFEITSQQPSRVNPQMRQILHDAEPGDDYLL